MDSRSVHQRTDGLSNSSVSHKSNNSSPTTSPPSSIPSIQRHHSAYPTYHRQGVEEQQPCCDYEESRDSVDTYASTPSASVEDISSRRSSCSFDSRYHPDTDAMPSTPPLFAQLFPSTRQLAIKHDDSTADGNMNLRIDTNVAAARDPARYVTLFHLRMYDLKKREMSLRRYGRDRGREVVNFRRKFAKPAAERPKLQRSGSKFMSSFRGKEQKQQQQQQQQQTGIARQDSGYESFGEGDSGSDSEGKKRPTSSQEKAPVPTNNLLLEFSNYAHVELRRRGSGGSKRYEFEYWGKDYAWKRRTTHVGQEEHCSYTLLNVATNNVVAQIIPQKLSRQEIALEDAKGGFVPPCIMTLSDSNSDSAIGSMTDVADVVIATGISALVDDCIKRRFSRKQRVVQLVLPTIKGNSVKMNMEYIGPKRLLDQVFKGNAGKKGHNASGGSRPTSLLRSLSSRGTAQEASKDPFMSRPTPLRAASTRA